LGAIIGRPAGGPAGSRPAGGCPAVIIAASDVWRWVSDAAPRPSPGRSATW